MRKIDQLTNAIIDGNILVVKKILSSAFLNGYFLKNKRNSDGHTPLTTAIVYGKIEIFNYLIQNGANTTKKNSIGNSPITLALFYAREDMLKKLIFEHKLNPSPYVILLYIETNKKVKTNLLNQVFTEGRLDSLKLFVKFNLPIDYSCFPNIAHADENFEEMLNYCIKNLKIDINTTNANGETALFIATNLGYVDKINLLLNYGADKYNAYDDVLENVTNYLNER